MKSLAVIYLAIASTFASGQILVGNGGDIIKCRPSATGENDFDGYYFLDYVATFDSVLGRNAYHSTSNPLGTIIELLNDRFPALGNSLNEFVRVSNDQIGGVPDYEQRYIWIRANNGLNLLHDEQLSFLPEAFPENCLEPNVQDFEKSLILYQVVIHQTRGDARVYKYDNRYMNHISNNPLQKSFMYTHEWLWQFTDSADIVRDVNKFLHSKELADTSPQSLRRILRNMGLDIDNIEPSRRTIQLDRDGGYESETVVIDPEVGVELIIDNAINGYFILSIDINTTTISTVYMRPDHLNGPTTFRKIFREPTTITVATCNPDTRECGRREGLVEIRYVTR